MVRMNRLNDIVMRQQQKLDIQHELMLTKEKRLEVLRDAGKLHAVEAKVRSLRARREAVEEQENRNAMLRVELDRLAGLFRQKQTDLNGLVHRVDVLASQLDELERSSSYVQQLRERLEKKRASNEGLEGTSQPGGQPLKYRNTLPPNSRINRPFTAIVTPQPRSRETEASSATRFGNTNAEGVLVTAVATTGTGLNSKLTNSDDLGSGSDSPSDATNSHNTAPVDKSTKGKTKDKSRRVSFDPLALLLDAALEGELDLVARIVSSTMKPHNDEKGSEPTPIIDHGNDEGITALHNAICASHLAVVLYLIEAGCDVNAQDADGWTPLHCAASCNNARVAKALVEAGACVYAMTHADRETPLEKCERQEPGFDECLELLMSAQNRLDGRVYAMFAYEKENDDELSYERDHVFTVLRRGDGKEREWYWCRAEDTGEEGYVARNLLASYPRKPRRTDVDMRLIEAVAAEALSNDAAAADDDHRQSDDRTSAASATADGDDLAHNAVTTLAGLSLRPNNLAVAGFGNDSANNKAAMSLINIMNNNNNSNNNNSSSSNNNNNSTNNNNNNNNSSNVNDSNCIQQQHPQQQQQQHIDKNQQDSAVNDG